jgi:hypothetical protein
MWPKIMRVRGLEIEVSDWDEVDEAINRYGNEGGEIVVRDSSAVVSKPKALSIALDPHDLTLLRRFIEESSLSTADIGRALGKSGKGIRRGMAEWSRKVGLTPDGQAFAFEACFRGDGRGYKMIPHFREVGRAILEGRR